MLVREALVGVAQAAGLEALTLNDVRTAVTEACNNVVLHAYDGAEGPLELEVYVSGGELEVIVRDQGTGIRPQIGAANEGSSGLGLLVIQALADRVVFQGAGGLDGHAGWDGTEVRMSFAAPGSQRLVVPAGQGADEPIELARLEDAELATTTTATVAHARVTSSVLPRLLSALAARARFSAERISDAQLVADELAAHAGDGAAGGLSLAVTVGLRDLRLRILPAQGPEGRLDGLTPGKLGPVIERLTDDQRVSALDSTPSRATQMLDLRMVEQR
jgi:anti-sigma regulatory factor (Ser/Thr protein kinase)